MQSYIRYSSQTRCRRYNYEYTLCQIGKMSAYPDQRYKTVTVTLHINRVLRSRPLRKLTVAIRNLL